MKYVMGNLRGAVAVAFAVGVGSMGLSRVASAALELDLSINSAPPIVIVDNGPLDSDSTSNAIAYTSTVTGFTFSFVTASTNNPGGATGFLSDTQTLIANNTGSPISVVASLTDTGFNAPTANRILQSSLVTSFLNPSDGSSVSLTSSADNGITITSTPTLNLATSGNVTNTTPVGPSATYSLTSVTSISLNQNDSVAVSSTTALTPEPAAVALLALSALGFLARRSRIRISG